MSPCVCCCLCLFGSCLCLNVVSEVCGCVVLVMLVVSVVLWLCVWCCLAVFVFEVCD